MKKLLALVLALAMIFTLAACGKTEKEPEGGASDDGRIHLKFAWIVDNIDISQQQHYDNGQLYLDFLNATRKDIFVETDLFDCLADVEQQTTNLELAIASNYDAIILSAVNEDAARTYVEQAESIGIPVLNWREDNGTVYFVGASEDTKGVMAADWFNAYLEANPDVVLNVCLQQGSTSHPNCYPRIKGVYATAEKYPDRFIILTEQNSDWSAETSMAMTEDWIQKYPEMNCLVSSSEEQMLGCIEALRGAGMLDKMLLVTYNGEQTGVDMIKAGEIAADVGSRPTHFIPLLLETTIKMTLEGTSGTVNLSDQVLYMVTPENVAEYEACTSGFDFMKNTYFESTLLDDYTGYTLYYADLRS